MLKWNTRQGTTFELALPSWSLQTITKHLICGNHRRWWLHTMLYKGIDVNKSHIYVHLLGIIENKGLDYYIIICINI